MPVFPALHRLLLDLLAGCVGRCARHAWATLLVATAISASLLWYTATHLGINTDTAGMLDPDLPFQRAAREFNDAFPALNDQVVIVVEAASGGAAAATADELARRLREQPWGGPLWARRSWRRHRTR